MRCVRDFVVSLSSAFGDSSVVAEARSEVSVSSPAVLLLLDGRINKFLLLRKPFVLLLLDVLLFVANELYRLCLSTMIRRRMKKKSRTYQSKYIYAGRKLLEWEQRENLLRSPWRTSPIIPALANEKKVYKSFVELHRIRIVEVSAISNRCVVVAVANWAFYRGGRENTCGLRNDSQKTLFL